jgi:hypothetical protein
LVGRKGGEKSSPFLYISNMEILIKAIEEGIDYTLSQMSIDGCNECYVLEDGHKDIKERGTTRIPRGRYELKIRKAGTIYQNYIKKFSWHKGMIEIADIPNFKYVMVHIGNTVKDTDGCPLLGAGKSWNGKTRMVTSSTLAYKAWYEKVYPVLEKGEKVFITLEA